jgi:dihydrodipicolinate synthase/N-acetylneuraminate lyase
VLYLAVKRSRVPLIAGVSHSTLGGALQLADEAIAAGADGLILMPPIFYPYTQCDIEEFYLQFARETGDAVPILLHNMPQCTSEIEVETVRRLITSGRFAGIKDASGDWDYFSQLLQLKREMRFAIMCGADRFAARALAEGADGAISASACAVPELVVRLAANPQNELLHARLGEFVEWVNRFPFPVAIKRAVELRGQKSAPPLTPLAPGTAQLLADFSAWFPTWFNAWLKHA